MSLGGGYSWKTNQFGLTIDTITAIDLVLPSGQAVHVTNSSYPELFFGLKVSGECQSVKPELIDSFREG